MSNLYFVLFVYLQNFHQSTQHQSDSSVLLGKLLRNRRQSDSTKIIFCDADYDDCNSQQNQGNLITDPLITSTTNQPITSTVAVPDMGTTPNTACERTCRTTPEYNPVCGDDNVTYPNINRFKCVQQCGKIGDSVNQYTIILWFISNLNK